MIVHSADDRVLDFVICDICKKRVKGRSFGIILDNKLTITSLTTEFCIGCRVHLCPKCLISIYKLINRELEDGD